jgi:hypothetical protein
VSALHDHLEAPFSSRSCPAPVWLDAVLLIGDCLAGLGRGDRDAARDADCFGRIAHPQPTL